MWWVSAVHATVSVFLFGMCIADMKTTDLASSKKIRFKADLSKGEDWGVRFQLADGAIGFKVHHQLATTSW